MKLLIVTSVAVFVAACAYSSAPADDGSRTSASKGRTECFYASNVTGFREGENGNIIVNTNSRDYYELRPLGGYCANFDFENHIVMRARTGGFVCAGYDADIYVADAIGARQCPVRNIRKLSVEEVAALRSGK